MSEKRIIKSYSVYKLKKGQWSRSCIFDANKSSEIDDYVLSISDRKDHSDVKIEINYSNESASTL